jgi:uncharacterized caspase-like protein
LLSIFEAKLPYARTALFYYSGHGMQIEGKNYIVPVDSNFSSKYTFASVDNVKNAMARFSNSTNILILDACRNNGNEDGSTKGRSIKRAISLIQKDKGLAAIQGVTNMFIAYSTSPGEVAADGDGLNGLYTKYLLKFLPVKGLSIEQTFKRVRRAVQRESGGGQVPWENSSLLNDFYFVPEVKPQGHDDIDYLISEIEIALEEKRFGPAYSMIMKGERMAITSKQAQIVKKLKANLSKSLGN